MQISSIVIHYKRPENVDKWMAGIKNQTVKSKIIVWDNSGDYPSGSGEDILIRCSQNIYCQARTLIAGIVKTPYIYNQDDDLAIKDNTLFEQFIEHAEKYPDYVIGWNGRMFSQDINWDKAYQEPGKGWVDFMDFEDSMSIDMINYGVSFMRTALINQIPVNPYKNDTHELIEDEYKYADDIWNSYWLKLKRTMPFKLLDKYEWLNEFQERKAALSKQPRHMDMRNKVIKDLYYGKYTK